ncbi:hypothetical protein ES707_03831 [subsurface metagenome]
MKLWRLSLKVTTPEDCWDCMELCKKSKLGVNLFSRITLDSIKEHKKKYKVDSTRIRGEKGRLKVNREEAFKLFALDRPKKYIKKQLRMAEASYFRIRNEYEALSQTEKNEIVKGVDTYS